MMRALYSAATGMMAQQTNMDVISNNLANVNTVGFKHSRADFQDLMYQEMRPAGAAVADGVTTPTGLEIGLGVKPAATETMFDPGSLQNTGNPLDVAIQGNGFFQGPAAGRHHGLHPRRLVQAGRQGKLVNSDGYAIQPEITIPAGSQVTIGADGTVSVVQGSSTPAADRRQDHPDQLLQPGGPGTHRRQQLPEHRRLRRPHERHRRPERLRDAGAGHAWRCPTCRSCRRWST